jgi:tetratricopeptide (TPR) repeat protein
LVVLSTDAWRIQEPPDWAAAQRFAQAAVDMAELLGSLVDLSPALGALANVLDGRSRLREHLHIAQKRLAIGQQPHFDDVRERIDALRSVGAALMYVGEYEQARPYLRQAEDLAVQAQLVEQQANALGLQAQCYFRLDRWDEVLATEEKWRALEQVYARERVGETCFFVALSASVHALRGDLARAELYAQEAYDYMVSMSGSPEQWQRNQFY